MLTKIIRYLITIVIVIAAFYGFHLILGMYVADVYYSKSQALLSDSQLIEALDYANKSIEKNPNEANYYKGRARVYLALSGSVKDQKDLLKKKALSDIQFAFNLNTSNLVVKRNIVPLYYFLAANDLYLPGGPDNVDSTYLPIAKTFFDKMKDDYPNDVGVYVLIAKYEKRLGLSEDLIATKKHIEELRPDLLEWNDSLR